MPNTITVMKQTVSIFAPDINIASKSSAIQLWLNRKNQFFSSVLEEGVWLSLKIWGN